VEMCVKDSERPIFSMAAAEFRSSPIPGLTPG
jgi:hypothetical protein